MYLREDMFKRLKGKFFDLLVIGGGATGAGIALDASSRGLKVALVEKNDFSSGSSGKSTKLIHGGVRYLEKAVLHLDKVQYSLVKDALKERYFILKNASYLGNRLSLVTPLYKYHEIPYIYFGLFLYDLLSGKKSIGRSKLLSKKNVENLCKYVNKDNLKAAVEYFDGQFFDTRLNIAIIKTALNFGLICCNYLIVKNLLKKDGLICGATVEDIFTQQSFNIFAKSVVNATGPYVDSIRRLDDKNVEDMVTVSSGIHIVIDKKYTENNRGLMIPKTEDKRVLFILPWNDHTLVGTTDEKAVVEDHPIPKKSDIDYLLRHVNKYFEMSITENDIKSKWSGLRPLVKDLTKDNTSNIVRDHVIEISESGLFTITGGKWTTYRKMAQDIVDKLITYFNFKASGCITQNLLIDGATKGHFSFTDLAERYGVDTKNANRLYRLYGTNSKKILDRIKDNNKLVKPDHPFFQEEINYIIEEELAQRASDILARRLTLALVDIEAARDISKDILEIMRKKLAWDDKRFEIESKEIEDRLNTAL